MGIKHILKMYVVPTCWFLPSGVIQTYVVGQGGWKIQAMLRCRQGRIQRIAWGRQVLAEGSQPSGGSWSSKYLRPRSQTRDSTETELSGCRAVWRGPPPLTPWRETCRPPRSRIQILAVSTSDVYCARARFPEARTGGDSVRPADYTFLPSN